MDIKKQVLHQFGKSADRYVQSQSHAKGKDLNAMVEISEAEGKSLLLDIATGGGHVANAFAPLVKKVIAYDLTPEILASAEHFIQNNGHNNVEFVQGDAESLPFEKELFDVITCRIAAHHFPNVKNFIQEVYRVLKTGGLFLLVDNVAPEKDELDNFYNRVEIKRDPSHYRAWKKSEWIKFIEEQGFKIEMLYTFEKTFQFLDWCERMDLPLSERKELEQYMFQADERIKKHFAIVTNEEQVIRFNGEAILLKARKN